MDPLDMMEADDFDAAESDDADWAEDADWASEDAEDDFDLGDEEDDMFLPEDVLAMEALGALAAESLEDEEAEDAFIGALASIASKALPLVSRAAPFLKRAGQAVFNHARRSPAVRSAIRSVPTVLRRTAADQLRRVSAGRPVSLNSTMRSAARHTSRIINNPRRRRMVVRRQQRIVRRGGQNWRRVCRWVRLPTSSRRRRR